MTAAGSTAGDPITPLERCFEVEGLPQYAEVPSRLRRLYGGGIGFRPPVLVGNAVASVDGVVALGPGHPSAGSIISGHAQADRFVMALLRACADAILIGAGTLRETPGHRWTAEQVCPWAAPELAALRRALGRSPRPPLVVVTRSGSLPGGHPALDGDAVVATTRAGRARLRAEHPRLSVLPTAPADHVDLPRLMGRLKARGWTTVLCEGGPILIGELVRAGLLDELFLTVAPTLAGRRPGRPRPGVIDGLELLPRHRAALALLGVRRHGSLIFLRYSIGSGPVAGSPRAGRPPTRPPLARTPPTT